MERIGPGALLAGRYQLVERVHADPVAALWRAEDVTLERPAAVRVLAPGHTHVDSTLDAARRAAIVDDGRLQRVLGVGVEAGCGYVILEWIEGPGAADLAGRVGEAEARRIVREAAEAVETARTRGLRHGRLTPGHVRRTADGRVRVIGLAVDAATIGRPYLAGPDAADPADLVAILYALVTGHHPLGFVEGLLGAPTSGGRPVALRELRPETSAELDELCVRTFAGTPPATAGDVAALLRQAVTGTPGTPGLPTVAVVGDPLPGGARAGAGPAVPGSPDTPAEAPFDARSDTVTDGVGAEGPAGTVAVPETEQVAVGDPGPDVDRHAPPAATTSRLPTQPPPRHDDVPNRATAPAGGARDREETVVHEVDLRPFDRDGEPGPPLDVASAASAAGVPSAAVSPVVTTTPPPGALPVGASSAPPSPNRRAVVALRDTIAGHASTPRWRRSSGPRPSAGSTRPSGMEWSGRGTAGVRHDDDWSILPIPAEGPEDPVWQARHQPVTEWEPAAVPPARAGMPVPAVADPDTWDDEPADGGVGGGEPDHDPLFDDGDGSRRRGGWIAGLTIAALLVVVTAVAFWAVGSVRGPADVTAADATASAEPTTTAPSADASVAPVEPPPPAPVVPVAVQPLDPQGDNAENDELVTLAIDGDPATSWESLAYETQGFGNLKTGLGIVVNLGEVVPTGGLSITAPGEGGAFEIRTAAQPVFDGSTVIADGTTSNAGPVQLTWDPVETQYLIVWFTALPQNDGRWRAVVSEIAPT